MACAIIRSSFSEKVAETIRDMLCLTPDVPNTRYQQNSREQVAFFRVKNGIVHLPFLYAASLFQTIPNDNIVFPAVNWSFTGNLRANQVPVEAEAWSQVETKGTTTLGLYPGFGKTILGASLSSRPRPMLLTCILVHREILCGQWRKTYQTVTNARTWIVGEPNPPAQFEVIICMDTRWMHIPEQVRNAVGFLIIDEAHAFCTPGHVDCLLSFHPKYVVAETATLMRDDGMHSMIYAICGEHGVFRETNIPFTVMKITTNTKPERALNRQGGINWAALVESTLFDERRNFIICNLVLANPTRTILILTSRVDHAYLLQQQLTELNISCGTMVRNQNTYAECQVLIGTMSKIGTGFDQESACDNFSGRRFDTLILASSIKKYSMLVQNVGRAFRTECPTIMHLVDDDSIYTNHWYKCRKWYLMHSGTIVNHDIRNVDRPMPTENMPELQQQWAQSRALKLKVLPAPQPQIQPQIQQQPVYQSPQPQIQPPQPQIQPPQPQTQLQIQPPQPQTQLQTQLQIQPQTQPQVSQSTTSGHFPHVPMVTLSSPRLILTVPSAQISTHSKTVPEDNPSPIPTTTFTQSQLPTVMVTRPRGVLTVPDFR